MGMYYISICHDCQKQVRYMDKWTEESAVECHESFKKDHIKCNVELGNDYMDDSKFWNYVRVDDKKYIE